MPKPKKGLTPKQELFIEEYLVDLNATQAAIRAGYSKKTAHAIGQENLRKPIIAAALDKARAKIMARVELSQDDIFQTWANIIKVDPRDVLDKPMEEWTRNDAAAVAGVKYTDSGREVKLYDRLRATELAGKHLGMFSERREISGPGGGPIVMEGLNDKEIAQRVASIIARGSEGGSDEAGNGGQEE